MRPGKSGIDPIAKIHNSQPDAKLLLMASYLSKWRKRWPEECVCSFIERQLWIAKIIVVYSVLAIVYEPVCRINRRRNMYYLFRNSRRDKIFATAAGESVAWHGLP